MSNRAKRRQHRPSTPSRNQAGKAPAFTPVPVRTRMDGWTPDRQVAFVTALAATACIEEACRAVGMSPRSYYDLRARPGSDSFRQAVEAALDVGTHRLETALLSRAIHGEATPIFYKGEQVGERRRYDNRLGLALLRARAADRYGAWRDKMSQVREHPDGAALLLTEAKRRLAEDGKADLAGRRRPKRAPLRSMIHEAADADEPAEKEDGIGTAAWVERHGFSRDMILDGKDDDHEKPDDAAPGDEDWEVEEPWTDEDWAREEAYAEELAAQTAEPVRAPAPSPVTGPAPGPGVSTAYTSPPDGG